MANNGKFMVKMASDDTFASIRIRDVDFNERFHTVCVYVKNLRSLLCGELNNIIEDDCGNFVKMYTNNGKIYFYVLSISTNMGGRITGQREVFGIDMGDIERLLNGERIAKVFYKNCGYETARMQFSDGAQKMIGKYSSQKIMRHALRKAFRDNFKYGRDEGVRIYNDFGEFGFSTEGLCGGLIVHTKNRRGKDGKIYPETYFGIHT